jgi:hypothetical protein
MHPSMLSQDQSMPFPQSYSSNPAFHISKKTPSWTHSWKRSCAVDPGQKMVASRAFQGQPVRSTKKMASIQTRSGVRGLPPPKGWVFTWGGSNHAISAQRSSGMRQALARSRFSWSIVIPLLGWPAAQETRAAAFRSYSPVGVIRIGSNSPGRCKEDYG